MFRKIAPVVTLLAAVLSFAKPALADEPAVCGTNFPTYAGRRVCFTYVQVYWGVDSGADWSRESVFLGPTQADADQTVRQVSCSDVGNKGKARLKEIRRKGDGTVICKAS